MQVNRATHSIAGTASISFRSVCIFRSRCPFSFALFEYALLAIETALKVRAFGVSASYILPSHASSFSGKIVAEDLFFFFHCYCKQLCVRSLHHIGLHIAFLRGTIVAERAYSVTLFDHGHARCVRLHLVNHPALQFNMWYRFRCNGVSTMTTFAFQTKP